MSRPTNDLWLALNGLSQMLDRLGDAEQMDLETRKLAIETAIKLARVLQTPECGIRVVAVANSEDQPSCDASDPLYYLFSSSEGAHEFGAAVIANIPALANMQAAEDSKPESERTSCEIFEEWADDISEKHNAAYGYAVDKIIDIADDNSVALWE